jgi:hypothetical protein
MTCVASGLIWPLLFLDGDANLGMGFLTLCGWVDERGHVKNVPENVTRAGES